jgi:hypothetical protein
MLGSCAFDEPNPQEPIAEVFGENLYPSDLAQVFTNASGLGEEDSTQLVALFVRQWKINKILARKAAENLTKEDKDIDKLVEDYRNSLLIYRYQQKLVDDRVDTSVSEQEMQAYFEKNQDDFVLTQTIVKLRFVKLPKESKLVAKAMQLLKSDKPEDIQNLLKLCITHAENYFLDDEAWLLFDDVKREIPIESYNDVLYLRNNRTAQIVDDEFVYLVRFSEARFQNSASVFEYEKDRIRNIIIRERKNAFLKKMEIDLLLNFEAGK